MEGANLFLSRAPLLEPVVRLVGWRRSNYRPGRSWCRCACHSDPECTQAMVCVRLPAVKFKAGPSHGLGRGVRPLRSLRGAGRLLGVLEQRALSRLWPSNTFELQRSWGGARKLMKFLARSKVGQEALGGGSRSKQTTEVGQEESCTLGGGLRNVVRCEWAMTAAARDDSSQY